MSIRTVYSIVKPVPPERARELLDEAIARLPPLPGPRPLPDGTVPVFPPRQYVGLIVGEALVLADSAHRPIFELARVLDVPHMALRYQEGDHWDFTLYHRGGVVADFSTNVEYYHGDEPISRPRKHGNLDVFASTWGVAPELVAPYLIDWGALREPIRCRPTDKHLTGDCHQLHDFLHALGLAAPHGHPERFVFTGLL